MEAQPPEIEQHKQRPRVSINKKETKGLNNRKRPRVSTRKEPLKPRLQSILCGQEAVAVASLLTPPTLLRTLQPVHDAWAAGLHMVEEMLQCLIELAVAATTEEGYPQMLPRMTIGCGRVLVHHATIWAEHYLLSLVVIIIDGHPGQALCLVELVNHILPFILKRHVWRYDGYQWAISLGVKEWAQARYLLGDTSSGVQGQPFVFIFEVIGLALGQATLAVEVVDPILTYDGWRASFVDRSPQLEVGQRVEILLGGLLSFLKTEDSGTDFLDFRKVLVIQLEPSCPESGLRRSGQGCGLGVISFQLLSYLGGSGTIFGAACRGLIATFPESTQDLDLETSRRLLLLWGRLISLIRVSVGSLGDSLLDLLAGL